MTEPEAWEALGDRFYELIRLVTGSWVAFDAEGRKSVGNTRLEAIRGLLEDA